MEKLSLAGKIDARLRRRFDMLCQQDGITISEALDRILTGFFAELDGPKSLPRPTEQVTEQVEPALRASVVMERIMRLEGQVEALASAPASARFDSQALKRIADRLVQVEGQVEGLLTEQAVATTHDTTATMNDFRERLSKLEARPVVDPSLQPQPGLGPETSVDLHDLDNRLKALEAFDLDAIYSEFRSGMEDMKDALTAHQRLVEMRFNGVSMIAKRLADVEAWIALEVELSEEQGFEVAPPPTGAQVTAIVPKPETVAQMRAEHGIVDPTANERFPYGGEVVQPPEAVVEGQPVSGADARAPEVADEPGPWGTGNAPDMRRRRIVLTSEGPADFDPTLEKGHAEADGAVLNDGTFLIEPEAEPISEHAKALSPALRKLPKLKATHDKTKTAVTPRSEGPAADDPRWPATPGLKEAARRATEPQSEQPTGMRVAWTHKSLKHRMKVQTPRGRHVYILIDNRDGTWTLVPDKGGEAYFANLPAKEMAKKLVEADMRLWFDMAEA